MELQSESMDYRVELLSPVRLEGEASMMAATPSWRINVNDFPVPEQPRAPPLASRVLRRFQGTNHSLSDF